jgi:hypothetical protein
MLSTSLLSFVLFTPLEQFDNVVWLSTRGYETVDAYPLFVLETEFSPSARAANTTGGYSSVLTARLSGGFVTAAVALLAFSYALPALGTTGTTIVSALPPVSRLALIATLHVLTGAIATVWRTDLFYLTGVAGSDAVGFAFAPQLDRTLGIDETRVSFLLAFALLGGSEEADEEDVLLPAGADLAVVEDVVATGSEDPLPGGVPKGRRERDGAPALLDESARVDAIDERSVESRTDERDETGSSADEVEEEDGVAIWRKVRFDSLLTSSSSFSSRSRFLLVFLIFLPLEC